MPLWGEHGTALPRCSLHVCRFPYDKRRRCCGFKGSTCNLMFCLLRLNEANMIQDCWTREGGLFLCSVSVVEVIRLKMSPMLGTGRDGHYLGLLSLNQFILLRIQWYVCGGEHPRVYGPNSMTCSNCKNLLGCVCVCVCVRAGENVVVFSFHQLNHYLSLILYKTSL